MRLPCHAKIGGDFSLKPYFPASLSKSTLTVRGGVVVLCCTLAMCASAIAQSTGAIEGQIVDQHDAAVPDVQVVATNSETSTIRRTVTDESGRYQLVALSLGTYRIEVTHAGFQKQLIENLKLAIGQVINEDFQLKIGDVNQVVTVTSEHEMVEQSTIAVGHGVDQRMVQPLPLNGRYVLDLGLQVPGSVTSPQGACSSAPIRGLGSFAFTTAGNREETINYVINGVTLNNLTNSSITFQPSIGTVKEFKVDNSTFSADHGQSSGAIVTIATRSGTNRFHGEAF